MRVCHLPAEGHRRQRWANGAGWTREVWSQGAADGGFDWRASLADIRGEAPFSRFEGCDRAMLLVSGERLELRIDQGSEVLDADRRICRFPGEAAVVGAAAGPVVAFNLIWRRDRCRGELLLRPLVGPMLFFPEHGVRWLALLASGRGSVAGEAATHQLSGGDAVLIEEGDGSSRALVDGGGELALARVAALS